MKKLLLPKKMALYSKNITRIHEIQKTHISRMSYMCFSNMEFVNRILKYYLEFVEYSELSGNMIFLNLLKEREESSKEVQNFYVSSPIMYMVSRSLISLQYTVKRLQIKTAAENKILFVNSFIKNENSREHLHILRMLSFEHFSIVKEKEALFIPFDREGKIENWLQKKYIYWNEIKNWLEIKQIKQYGIESLPQVNFIPAKQRAKWTYLHAHLADAYQFVVGDLTVRNEAKKSRMQEWLFKFVRSYEEKKYRSLIGHVTVGKDVYFGKIQDRIQSGEEGKSDKFSSRVKFFAKPSGKWNVYPMVNSVKVQREWYSGEILRAFWSKLAWDINRIEKIPPVRLDAPRSIQRSVFLAINCMQTNHWVATAQVENSWKEKAEEENQLWEKGVNSLSFDKDSDTGRKLENWSQKKRIYRNEAKDIYFGKIRGRIQSGGEGKSGKFSSQAKFSAESPSKWNIYPIVNFVKVQSKWHFGGILGDFLLELALNINRIEKISPVQLNAPRSIQLDSHIRKIRAYALFASACATAQMEKFVQVRKKGYANRIIDFVKYQIGRSLNARNSRMAERKMFWQKNSWKEEVAEEEKHLWEKEINSLSFYKDRDTERKLVRWSQKKQIYWNGIGNWSQKKQNYQNEIENWLQEKQIYRNEIENWLQKKYIFWHEIKNWLGKKQIKQYEIENLSQINFIPAKQRAKWTCLHVHLATAARVKYPCCDGNLMPHQLAVGYLTPAKQRAKWTYLHAHLADAYQFVVGDLAGRNEAKKSRMQKRLFKSVRSYEEKKYRSLIGHVAVGKDIYFGKVRDRIQFGEEGKSDKFSSRVKFFAKPSGKWNVYPMVNSVKVQREWYSGGILRAFWSKLAWDINRIEKIPPVRLVALRSIQPDSRIRKPCAYALFASACATAQIEKFVQVREKGYGNRIIDFVKYQIGKSLNARNSRMAERKMFWQKNSWKEETEEEKHLWEKEINSLSLDKDRDTGRKLGNWSKGKRIYWNGIGNWSQKKWIYRNEIGNWSRKKQIYQNEIGNWLQKKYIYWNEIKNWLEKKQIKQYGIESLPQVNFIPAKQREFVCNYEEKKYRSLIGYVTVGKEMHSGKIQDRIQSGGEGKSDKFSSRAKFSSKPTRKWNAYPIVNSVKVQTKRHFGGILGAFWLKQASNINRFKKIPPVQIQEKGYANWIIDFVKCRIGRNFNDRNNRIAERKMLLQKNNWRRESEQLENRTRWHDIKSSQQENVIVHGKFDVPSVCCRVFGWNYALRQKKLWGLWSIYESGEKEKWINTISIRVKQYFNEIQNRMHFKKGRQINQIINLRQSPNEDHDNQTTKNNPFVRLDALRSIQPNSHIYKTRACTRFASVFSSFGSGLLMQRFAYPAINCMQTNHWIVATQAENNYSHEAADQIDILAYTFDLRQNDIIYVRENDLEKQALLKVYQKIQNIEEKFQEDLTREEQKNRKKKQALEMLEEKVAQQDKKIQELTAANMELQRKMGEDRNGQGQEDSYFEILNNDMKLERMRYGIIDF